MMSIIEVIIDFLLRLTLLNEFLVHDLDIDLQLHKMILERLFLINECVDSIIVYRPKVLQMMVLVSVVLDLLFFHVDAVLLILQLDDHLSILTLEVCTLCPQMIDLSLSLLY